MSSDRSEENRHPNAHFDKTSCSVSWSHPRNIQIVGNEVAIAWSDGMESYFTFEKLRGASPSAEMQGERDVLGVKHGGHEGPHRFEGVQVLGWEQIGNYAICFKFSDGHRTGLYSYDYLRNLGRSS